MRDPGELVTSHRDLRVYQRAMRLAMRIFEVSKRFPKEETYSLTDQIRRSSRSVCANLAEGWRKRRYEAAFVSKLADTEGEAAETQVWLEMAVRCGYLSRSEGKALHDDYEALLTALVGMIHHKEKWVLAVREETGDYVGGSPKPPT